MRTPGNGNARNTEHTTNIANNKTSRSSINNAKSDAMRHPIHGNPMEYHKQ